MKAMVLTDYGKLVVTEVPIPEIADDEILVRVRACGICGSDVHGYDGSTGRRIPPLIMGHEVSGVVERVGARVEGFAPGDRVAMDSTLICGECGYCREGRTNLCDRRKVMGVATPDFRRDGAYAEYVAVPVRSVYLIPDTLAFEHAALVEPLSVAAHAVARAEKAGRGPVAVIGTGMIGLLIVQVLREAGYREIIAVDVNPSRLELARKFGATQTIDARGIDVPARVRELTGGAGADTSFEVVGVTATIETAVRSVRKGGSVVLVGNVSPKVEIPLQDVVSRELTLLGSCAAANEIPAAIEMLARGAIDVASLIDFTAPLEEGPAIFERLHAGDASVLKVILQP